MENKAYQYPDCTFVECDKDKDYLWIKYDPETLGKKFVLKLLNMQKMENIFLQELLISMIIKNMM